MNELYAIAGVSKQAYHKRQMVQENRTAMEENIFRQVNVVRAQHPGMGARKVYHKLSPLPLGRDRFEMLLLSHGYRLRRIRSFVRTTIRHRRALDFPNLCTGLILQRINRVWVSDITYYRLGDRFCYLAFEMDLYSRRILGASVSETLEATGTLTALRKAFATRGFASYQYQLIHHSDPGTQYLSNGMLALCREQKCRVSTGKSVFENAHIERVHGIIKNEYLSYWTIMTIADLRHAVDQVVQSYNYDRPHSCLAMKTPVEFEEYVCKLPRNERPILCPYTDEKAWRKK